MMTLAQFLSMLRKRFWLIVAGALIAGVLAAILCLVWPPSYEASALLLITKLRPVVNFDPRFETATEENLVNLSIQDDQVRRQTLVGLAQSPDLLLAVLAQLADALPPEERTLGALRGATDVSTQGNLIVLEARADTADKAATIANAWAEVYVQRTNKLYSTTAPSVEQIEQQVADALAVYQAAKAKGEAFERESAEGALLRQITEKQQLLADLQHAQLDAARARMDDLLLYLNRLDRLLLNAQAQRSFLAGLPDSTPLTAGQRYALFNLEAAAFTGGTVLSTTLQMDIDVVEGTTATAGEAVATLDRLLPALGSLRATTLEQAEAEALALLNGESLLSITTGGAAADEIVRVQGEINELQAQLRQQQTMRADLLDAETVAKEDYLTLTRKAAEVQLLSQITGVEVQPAAEAQPPNAPAFPRPVLTIALGLLGGALAGLALAVLLEMWPRVSKPRGGDQQAAV
jgi:capsular polysaccharide biosynthesis protein